MACEPGDQLGDLGLLIHDDLFQLRDEHPAVLSPDIRPVFVVTGLAGRDDVRDCAEQLGELACVPWPARASR
jgi:hypothetical protein